MSSAPNWEQLGYEAAHLAITLVLILLFLLCVSWLFGKTFKESQAFFTEALKAEFTTVCGVFDLVMFLVFCGCIYSHALTELVFSALGLKQLAADAQLWNSDVKTIATSCCFIASIVLMGLVYSRKLPRRNR